MGDGRARPAGAEHDHAVGRGRPAARAANASWKPVVSVLWPVEPAVGVNTTVLTASSAAASCGQLVELGDDELLAGCVTLTPAMPAVARLAHERADVLRRAAELVEVEQPVLALEPELVAPRARAARG